MLTPPDATVHIVDDDAIVREGMAWLLRTRRLLSVSFDSAERFLAELDAQQAAWAPHKLPPQAGCILLDVRMPGMSGLALFELLLERGIAQAWPVIFLTGHADVSIAVQAMKQGACELIEKPFKDQTLLDAVGQAVRKDLAQRDEDATRQALRARLDKLSPREREVARLIVEGLPNKSIGQRLDISERTVQVHRLHVMEKLGIHSAAELTQLILRADK